MCHEFTIIEHNEPLQKRSLKRLMVVLLMIEGNCLTFRSKPAHLVGHLPDAKMSENVSPQKEKPLSAKQQSLIAALIEGKTIKAAAESIGIAEKTAHLWLKQPLFQKEYSEAKQIAYNEKLDMLKSGVSVALRTLLKHMTDSGTKPYVQVQAASKWLDATIEIHKMQELEMRIIELEERTKAGKQ